MSLAINVRSAQAKQRAKQQYLGTLNTASELEKIAIQAQQRALALRNSGGTLSASDVMFPKIPPKPKELYTEEDATVDLSRKLRPYMLNNNEVMAFIQSLKDTGSLLGFADIFDLFASSYLTGVSRLTATQIEALLETFDSRQLKPEPTLVIAPAVGIEDEKKEPEPVRSTPFLATFTPSPAQPASSVPSVTPSPAQPASTVPSVIPSSAPSAPFTPDYSGPNYLDAKQWPKDKLTKEKRADLKNFAENVLRLPPEMIDFDENGKGQNRTKKATFARAIIEFRDTGLRRSTDEQTPEQKQAIDQFKALVKYYKDNGQNLNDSITQDDEKNLTPVMDTILQDASVMGGRPLSIADLNALSTKDKIDRVAQALGISWLNAFQKGINKITSPFKDKANKPSLAIPKLSQKTLDAITTFENMNQKYKAQGLVMARQITEPDARKLNPVMDQLAFDKDFASIAGFAVPSSLLDWKKDNLTARIMITKMRIDNYNKANPTPTIQLTPPQSPKLEPGSRPSFWETKMTPRQPSSTIGRAGSSTSDRVGAPPISSQTLDSLARLFALDKKYTSQGKIAFESITPEDAKQIEPDLDQIMNDSVYAPANPQLPLNWANETLQNKLKLVANRISNAPIPIPWFKPPFPDEYLNSLNLQQLRNVADSIRGVDGIQDGLRVRGSRDDILQQIKEWQSDWVARGKPGLSGSGLPMGKSKYLHPNKRMKLIFAEKMAGNNNPLLRCQRY